jgi:hypothetical protein
MVDPDPEHVRDRRRGLARREVQRVAEGRVALAGDRDLDLGRQDEGALCATGRAHDRSEGRRIGLHDHQGQGTHRFRVRRRRVAIVVGAQHHPGHHTGGEEEDAGQRGPGAARHRYSAAFST